MKLAVVILNFNGRSYLQQFLPTVIEHSNGHEIIVADNCSTDDSVKFMQQEFPAIQLICLPENVGYSEGYNQTLRQLKDITHCVLLNSDVEVTPNWIEPVLEAMNQDQTIVAAQPKIRDYHQTTKFEYAGAGGGFIDSLSWARLMIML